MENTERITTLKAENVPYGEIYEVRDALAELIRHGDIADDSPLIAAIDSILNTLLAGKGITIIAQPAPEDYVLA